jgi:hypothetical protein
MGIMKDTAFVTYNLSRCVIFSHNFEFLQLHYLFATWGISGGQHYSKDCNLGHRIVS